MNLSIIIVNYKSAQLIIDCLKTVYAQTNSIRFEVIIVDNFSNDGGRESLAASYPDLRWVEMGYNAGFARANNEGIRNAKGDCILLLNPDTLIESAGIEKCWRFFRQSPYVACGVQLINPDRTPQISGSYFVKGALNNLLPLPYMGNWLRSMGSVMKAKIPHLPDSNTVEEVDWINGAFLMVKVEAIQKAGMMDEDFFLYAEESEWCYRLGKHGKLCIAGSIKVIHLQGETANRIFGSEGKGYYNLSDRKGLQVMVSNHLRIRKQYGRGWFLLHLLFYCLDIPVFFIGFLINGIFSPSKMRYSWAQWKGYSRNVISLIALAPRIMRNKPYFYKVL